MEQGIKALKKDPVLRHVYALARKADAQVYLVGGVLRNAALDMPPAPDYDFAVKNGVREFSQAVAKLLGGTAFLLDSDGPLYRVAAKKDGLPVTVDIAPIADGDIAADLDKRDFTVNAMAVELGGLFKRGSRPVILDPCGGLSDAKKGLLRMTSGGVFDEDPLRCLRAVRLSQQYGLRITEDTIGLIRRKSGLLKRSAAERIREELTLIFRNPGTPSSLRLLYDTGMMGAVLPEAKGWKDAGGYDLMTHAIKTIEEAEALLSTLSDKTFPGVSEMLKKHFEGMAGPMKRAVIFKLAAFLHDAGKPLTISREAGRLRFIGHDLQGSLLVKDALMKLRFSRKVSAETARLVRNHHRVFDMARLDERTARAKGHFFRAAGGGPGLDLICLALCDARATRGGEDSALRGVALELLAFYRDVCLKKKPRALFDGREIMRIFGVAQGRLVGEIISRISEGVESGAVRTKKEAVAYVKRWLSEEKKNEG